MKNSAELWPALLVCIMETLVPEDASKLKDDVEGKDNDEVRLAETQIRVLTSNSFKNACTVWETNYLKLVRDNYAVLTAVYPVVFTVEGLTIYQV